MASLNPFTPTKVIETANKIEKTLGFITILGNSYNNQTQLEAGIERAQYFISASSNDGINFVGAQIAKSLNNDINTIILFTTYYLATSPVPQAPKPRRVMFSVSLSDTDVAVK